MQPGFFIAQCNNTFIGLFFFKKQITALYPKISLLKKTDYNLVYNRFDIAQINDNGHEHWDKFILKYIDIINQLLPIAQPEESIKYFKKIIPIVKLFIAAIPKAPGEIILQLLETGRLRSFEHQDIAIFDEVINCSGLDLPVTNPLIQQLAGAGIIKINPFGGIKVNSNFQASAAPDIFALGPVIKGELLSSNFLYTAVQSASLISQTICRKAGK